MGARIDFIPGHEDYGRIFDGKFRDFSSGWYEKIGSTYVTTMVIYILTPILEFLGIWLF